MSRCNSYFPYRNYNKKTNEHQRVIGTKIFANIPNDYTFKRNLSRYQKTENLYIQFIESNASNFYQAKPNFTREVIESKGAKIDILKDIKLNDLDAVFGDGPSKKLNERKTILVFGNNEFVAIVAGVYPKNNIDARNEILEVFKNIVYQKNYKLDPFELANFEFDKSITGFKYAMTMSNMFAFTEDGNPEPVGEFLTSMNIGAMPKMSVEKSKGFIKSIIQNAENAGNTIKSSEIKTTTIGGYPASILDTQIRVKNKDGVLYVVVLNGDESSVIFMGTAFDNTAKFLEKYKKTVKTIKIK